MFTFNTDEMDNVKRGYFRYPSAKLSAENAKALFNCIVVHPDVGRSAATTFFLWVRNSGSKVFGRDQITTRAASPLAAAKARPSSEDVVRAQQSTIRRVLHQTYLQHGGGGRRQATRAQHPPSVRVHREAGCIGHQAIP